MLVPTRFIIITTLGLDLNIQKLKIHRLKCKQNSHTRGNWHLVSLSWRKWAMCVSQVLCPTWWWIIFCLFGLIPVSSKYHLVTMAFTSSDIASFMTLLSLLMQCHVACFASNICNRCTILLNDILLRPAQFSQLFSKQGRCKNNNLYNILSHILVLSYTIFQTLPNNFQTFANNLTL